jgi:hypothetical protein
MLQWFILARWPFHHLCRRSETRLAPRQLAAACVVVISATALVAADPPRSVEASGQKLVTPEAQRAIDSGLAFLAARQHPDGSFGSGSVYRRNVAVTSLAGMAFLSAGHTPGQGSYGPNVERAVEFILASSEPSGYIIRVDSAAHGPMYGHGFATLFLAEVYGMSPREEVRTKLKNAVQLIVNSQNREGGWRYDPDGKDADISVTVCQIMALRAARNCGIAVPKATVDQCVKYVRDCQDRDGGFRYQREQPPKSAFPRSAAAVVALYSAGVYEGPELQTALDYLWRHQPQGDLLRYEPHYFYGHYYAVQAMWHAGGQYWRQWYPAVRDELMSRQQGDGSWPDMAVCPEYGTAMACIALQLPNCYLPIFQR